MREKIVMELAKPRMDVGLSTNDLEPLLRLDGSPDAPVTLGETAGIATVCDPDGNWIGLSQRALIAGVLKQN